MRHGLAIQDDQLVSYVEQDTAPILDLAHDLRTQGKTGSSEFRHAATLPMVLIEIYCQEKGITFQEWIQNPIHAKTMVNDPALGKLRIWKGRV